jgi:hypothetical protein
LNLLSVSLFPSPSCDCPRPSHEIVLCVLWKTDWDDVWLKVDLLNHLEEGNVVLVAKLVKVYVGYHPSDTPREMRSSIRKSGYSIIFLICS